MANMSYCRHENTLSDLSDVWDKWWDFDADDAEAREVSARRNLRKMILDMAQELEDEDE